MTVNIKVNHPHNSCSVFVVLYALIEHLSFELTRFLTYWHCVAFLSRFCLARLLFTSAELVLYLLCERIERFGWCLVFPIPFEFKLFGPKILIIRRAQGIHAVKHVLNVFEAFRHDRSLKALFIESRSALLKIRDHVTAIFPG